VACETISQDSLDGKSLNVETQFAEYLEQKTPLDNAISITRLIVCLTFMSNFHHEQHPRIAVGQDARRPCAAALGQTQFD
jgi:hypothetical protein